MGDHRCVGGARRGWAQLGVSVPMEGDELGRHQGRRLSLVVLVICVVGCTIMVMALPEGSEETAQLSSGPQVQDGDVSLVQVHAGNWVDRLDFWKVAQADSNMQIGTGIGAAVVAKMSKKGKKKVKKSKALISKSTKARWKHDIIHREISEKYRVKVTIVHHKQSAMRAHTKAVVTAARAKLAKRIAKSKVKAMKHIHHVTAKEAAGKAKVAAKKAALRAKIKKMMGKAKIIAKAGKLAAKRILSKQKKEQKTKAGILKARLAKAKKAQGVLIKKKIAAVKKATLARLKKRKARIKARRMFKAKLKKQNAAESVAKATVATKEATAKKAYKAKFMAKLKKKSVSERAAKHKQRENAPGVKHSKRLARRVRQGARALRRQAARHTRRKLAKASHDIGRLQNKIIRSVRRQARHALYIMAKAAKKEKPKRRMRKLHLSRTEAQAKAVAEQAGMAHQAADRAWDEVADEPGH